MNDKNQEKRTPQPQGAQPAQGAAEPPELMSEPSPERPKVDRSQWGGIIKPMSELRQEVRAKLLLYGLSGTGKTQSACMSSVNGGEDTLVIQTETQGLTTVSRVLGREAQYVARVTKPEHFTAIQQAILYELNKHDGRLPWDTIVFDTLDDYQKVLKASRAEKSGTDKMTQNDWGVILDQTEAAMRFLRDCPCSLIVIAHTAEREMLDGASAIVPGFVGKATYERIASMCNLVFVQKKFTLDGGGVRYGMLTEGGEKFMTKTMPGLPHVLWPEEPRWKRLFHPTWNPPKQDEQGAKAQDQQGK